MISAFFDYAFFTHFAQSKEYRFDRLGDFLSSERGKVFLFDFRILWRTIIIVVLYTLLVDTISGIALLGIVVFVDLFSKAYQVVRHRVLKPRITIKASLAIAVAVAFETYIYFILGLNNITLLVMAFRIFVTALLVFLLNFLSSFTKRGIVALATAKMKKYPNLLVIGITGSYAKSTTKEFLAQLLSHSFKTIKTPRNINTEIGIAKFILQQDFSTYDMFVVEMGAYRMGDIKAICDIVHPKVGILTAISPQHFSLFGSMKNIQETKYELLRALPSDGLAITNVDNEYCRELLNTLDCKKRTFGSDSDYHPDILIHDAKNVENGISFNLSIDGRERTRELSLLGKHNVYNVVGASIAAKYAGMTSEQIDEAVQSLKPGHGSIVHIPYGKAIILNDNCCSNPEGFKAALDVLNTFPSDKKRIVITHGMEDLGERADEIHELIGGEISFVADALVLTQRDGAAAIARGVVNKYNVEVLHMYDTQKLLTYIRSQKDKSVVILIENYLDCTIQKELGM